MHEYEFVYQNLIFIQPDPCWWTFKLFLGFFLITNSTAVCMFISWYFMFLLDKFTEVKLLMRACIFLNFNKLYDTALVWQKFYPTKRK